MAWRFSHCLRWLDAHVWWRLVVFIVMPLVLIGGIYLWPSASIAVLVTAVADLLLLVVYLRAHRPSNLSLLVAVVPNTLGPLLASLFADRLLPNGEQLLANGADTLVAIAFLFAGYVSVFVYLLSRKSFKWPERLGVALLVVIPFLMAFFGADFSSKAFVVGPELVGGVHAPAVTVLFVSRAIIVLAAALIAVVADHEEKNAGFVMDGRVKRLK